MTARAFGDNHVQGHILTAGAVAGYLPDAISRWRPQIAQNGVFADRGAIQVLIQNDQNRIDANAKHFAGQMHAKYTPSSHSENFHSDSARKEFLKQKAKNKKILILKLNWWYEIVLGPNNNMIQFSLFGYDMGPIPARRYMVFTCSKDPTTNTWQSNTVSLRSVDEDDAEEAELEQEMEDLLAFDYVDDGGDDNYDKKLQLPPNFQSVLGGIDASCAAFSREGFKGNLFNMASTDGDTYSCYVDGRNVEFAVPSYVTMTWGSESTSFSIVGESKKEFTNKLSKKLNLGGDFFGFGGEFERTFDETRTEETFKKYMARYNQEVVYSVAFKDEDNAAKYLSNDAVTAMKTWTPEKIVTSFGTHYTIKATVGGSRILASSLDTRDEFTETEMSTAIELKAKFKDAKGGDAGSVNAETSSTDKKSQKLFESLQTVNTHTIGGTATDDKENLGSWRQSLHTNPALINYKLRPIEELVPADLTVEQGKDAAGKPVTVSKRSLVKKAARALIDAQAPVDHCTVLAIKVPLKPYYSDAGSGAKHDMTVAYPDVPKGWLRVSQFAQGTSWKYAFRGQSYTYAVRANPNLDLLGIHGTCPCPGVVAATHANSIWKGRANLTLGQPIPPVPTFWRPYYQPYNETQIKADYTKIIQSGGTLGLGLDVNKPLLDQYSPLGDIFEPLVNGQKELTNLNSLALFHKDMVVKLKKSVNTSLDVQWLWDDSGSGAPTDVTVLGLPISRGNLGPNDETLLMEAAPETSTALPFWCTGRSVDPTKYDGITLDWIKVKILRNEWLSK